MSVAVAVMFVFDFSEASPIKKNHNSGYSVSCLFFFFSQKVWLWAEITRLDAS
jgi:hypothetical protein